MRAAKVAATRQVASGLIVPAGFRVLLVEGDADTSVSTSVLPDPPGCAL